MAALHEIARQYAEEIRDGIAWVIIWKTGRSWHAESVWLNQDSDTFELEDLSTAAEILEQDPNAVMVNGYYCGHFGENMTIAEYFETVPHKTTKTKHSYRLLSGTLVKKLGGSTMKQDDDTLLAYLKASGNEDMIQNTEKPKWCEFKKRLEIVGGQIVDKTTGELVEGVQIIEKPDTFTVDV